jgi:hypothetical protein
VFTEILKNCSLKNLSPLLNAVISLTFASTSQVTVASRARSMSTSSDTTTRSSTGVNDTERIASNLTAFKMLQDLLLFKNSRLLECLWDESVEEKNIEDLSQSEFSSKVMITARKCALLSMSKTSNKTVVGDDICQLVLDTVLQIYSRHPDNCELLEPKFHMLSLYFAGLNSFRSSEMKHMVHSTLEYVSIGASGEIPVHALQAASLAFLGLADAVLDATASDVDGFNSVLIDCQAVKSTLIRLISFDNSLGEVLCSCGLMNTVLIPLLNRVEKEGLGLVKLSEGTSANKLAEGALSVGVMVCAILDELLKASSVNVEKYRELEAQVNPLHFFHYFIFIFATCMCEQYNIYVY